LAGPSAGLKSSHSAPGLKQHGHERPSNAADIDDDFFCSYAVEDDGDGGDGGGQQLWRGRKTD
jgi:hypothetical protein